MFPIRVYLLPTSVQLWSQGRGHGQFNSKLDAIIINFLGNDSECD